MDVSGLIHLGLSVALLLTAVAIVISLRRARRPPPPEPERRVPAEHFVPKLKLDTTYGECTDVRLEQSGFDLNVSVQYRRTDRYFERLFTFNSVAAYGFYDEMTMPLSSTHCSDKLCEVLESDWLARWQHRKSPADKYERHHFAIYFSDCGYLEVLANSFAASDEKALAGQ